MTDSYQPKTYREQGGDRFVIKAGGSLRDEQPAGGQYPSVVFHHEFPFNHVVGAAAETQNLTLPDGIEVIDAYALKTGAGGSATTGGFTLQLQSSTGGAISNAITCSVVNNARVAIATLNDALKAVGRGGVLRAVRAGGNGATAAGKNIAATLHVLGVKRST